MLVILVIDVSHRVLTLTSVLMNKCQIAVRDWWLVGLQELGQGVQQEPLHIVKAMRLLLDDTCHESSHDGEADKQPAAYRLWQSHLRRACNLLSLLLAFLCGCSMTQFNTESRMLFPGRLFV